MSPIIGLTSNYFGQEHHAGGPKIMPLPDQAIYTVPEDCARSIERNGGIAVMLPVTDDLSLIRDYVELCEGIIIIGGVCDVNPQLYGEKPSDLINKPVVRNDAFDLAMARYVINNSDKPLLGICRGAHVINVSMGGTLVQDLVSDGYPEHCFMDRGKTNPQHRVTLEKDSFVYRALGKEIIQVNSLHHQAVKDLAPCMRATGRSDDGVIESYEMVGQHLVIGIQWHPEMMLDSELQQGIFKAFIQACAEQSALHGRNQQSYQRKQGSPREILL